MTRPDQHESDDVRRGGLVRRVLNPGPSAEQRLEELLAKRRSELEAHAASLRESIEELERREELLRDSRASVERMLRLGTSDLEAREAELTDFLAGLTEREAALTAAEEDIARRRQELGAVELKRAAVERRERAVDARESDLEQREAAFEEQAAAAGAAEPKPVEVELVFLPGERYRIVDVEPVELTRGYAFDVEGLEYVVARIGRSPLPGDGRRCAYLVLGRNEGGSTSSDGSS
jgi:hypothetical protein